MLHRCLTLLLTAAVLGVHSVNAASGDAKLLVQDGVAVNPMLFGLNDVLGPIINLTYFDTAVRMSAEAVHLGVLRHPGGTVANYWSLEDAGYIANCTGRGHGAACCSYQSRIDALPPQTFSPGNFLHGLAQSTVARSAVWDLNLLTLSPQEAVAQLGLLKDQVGEALTHIELGNEFYLESYRWRFPNATSYMQAALPTIQSARSMFPKAKIAAVGNKNSRNWLGEVSTFSKDIDAVTVHDYSTPSPASECKDLGKVLAWSDVAVQVTVENVQSAFAHTGSMPHIWQTEFNLGLSKSSCNASEGAHAIFMAARQLAAVNHHDVWKVLQLHAFLSEDGTGWDSRAGVVRVGSTSNDTSSIQVGALAQVMAHVNRVAMGTTPTPSPTAVMHPVTVSGGPTMPVTVANHGDLPCLQAAAFTPVSTTSFVVVNRCADAVEAVVPVASARKLSVTTYDAREDAGFVPLPSSPSTVPWTAPLHPAISTLSVTAPSFKATIPGYSMVVME